MNKNVKEFFEKMQEFFPSTKKSFLESVEEYGEVLETVVIEDIFMPEVLALLVKNEDSELLSNMFNYFEEIIHFLRREMLDFTAFPVFFVSNLLLVQRKKYYFNRAMVSRNCSIVL